MRAPHILHHRAVSCLTCPFHQAMDATHSLLIDCGLFQVAEASPGVSAGAGNLAIDFSLGSTPPVHIDHLGRVTYLLAAGFKGPVLCSGSSAKLLPIALKDVFKLGFSCDQKQVERDLKLIERHIIDLPYKQWIYTKQLNMRIRLKWLVTFSARPMFRWLFTPSRWARKNVSRSLVTGMAATCVDLACTESTQPSRYPGHRKHLWLRLVGRTLRSSCAFREGVRYALSNQSTVLIPAFSIGRTQELLCELEDIIHRRALKEAASVQPNSSRLSASKGLVLDSAGQSFYGDLSRARSLVGCRGKSAPGQRP